MKLCSFTSFSKCHQGKFTKKKRVTAVQESQRQLLAQRAGISVSKVKTICDHHEKELLTCHLITKKKSISSQLKNCSNPFNIKHKAGRHELHGITETLLQKYPVLMGLVEIGDKICTSCRIKARDSIGSHAEPTATGEVQGGDVDPLPSTSRCRALPEGSSSESQTAPSASSESASPERAVTLEQLNTIMTTVGETPIRTGEHFLCGETYACLINLQPAWVMGIECPRLRTLPFLTACTVL